MNIVCFYHAADYDGICSGAIVKHWAKTEHNIDAILLGVDYHYDFKDYEKYITLENEVYVIDFSWPLDVMQRIEKEAKKLIWIDHHGPTFKEFAKSRFNPYGLRADGVAACQLTWVYLFSMTEIPRAIELLGRYDIWDLDDNVLAFQYGVKSLNLTIEDPAWESLFGDSSMLLKDIFDAGWPVYKYVQAEDAKYMKSFAFETEIDGFKVLACNRAKTNFLFFKSMYDPKKHDMVCSYAWTGTTYAVSLYTDKEDVDVSVICKKYGGGGHKKASGFSCEKLPFKEK